MKYIIPAAIAVGVGLVTLLGYFIQSAELLTLRTILINWAVILGGLAVLVGLLNLIIVHFRRMQTGARGSVYSLLTVAAAVATFVVGAAESLRNGGPTLYQQGSLTYLLFTGVVIASQAALASLVMFFLVVAAVRMLQTKPDRWSVLFLATVVVTLVGWLPLAFLRPLNSVREWLLNVAVSAGARGILIGVALGVLMVGIRVLTGVERPYKD
jgi:hypothetical protein